MNKETYRKYEELVDWLESECQTTEIADLSHSFAENLKIRLADISYLKESKRGTDLHPVDMDYVNECIEKATPNLSKIKDVDKELAEIRGEIEQEMRETIGSTTSNSSRCQIVTNSSQKPSEQHDPNCFHECPNCNCRCNCNSHPCSCCEPSEQSADLFLGKKIIEYNEKAIIDHRIRLNVAKTLFFIAAMEEYAQERTKDCYPKEFLQWSHTDNNLQLSFRDKNIPQWWVHLPDLNWRQLTLDELFTYWKENVKEP